MIVACPQCRTPLDVSAVGSGQLAVCQRCQHHLQVPGKANRIVPVAAPKYYPAPLPHNPLDFSATEEEVEDERRDRKEVLSERREVRDDRRSDRKIRGLERDSNMLGIIALAFAGTTFLLVLSGLLFQKALPFYGGLAGTLGVPGALTSLVVGFIGALRPGRSRLFAGIATGLGALLILILIPLLWVLLSQKNP